jgi:hypothetical protein
MARIWRTSLNTAGPGVCGEGCDGETSPGGPLCFWLNCVPPPKKKICLQFKALAPVDVASFGNGMLRDVIKLL